MIEVNPPDEGFINWRKKPESNIAIREVWFKEWERKHWEEDASEPEQPLTPEEQAKVDVYLSRIQETLERRDIKDEGLRERAMDGFTGIEKLQELYKSTLGGDREALIRAMGTVIDRTEQIYQSLINTPPQTSRQ